MYVTLHNIYIYMYIYYIYIYYIYHIYIYIYTYQWSSCFNTAGKFQSSYLYSFPIRTIENLQELFHPVASTVKGHSDLMIDQHLPH